MGLIRGREVAGRWLCKGLMLLAEGWSEVDSLDVGEKKRSNLSFSSSFSFPRMPTMDKQLYGDYRKCNART